MMQDRQILVSVHRIVKDLDRETARIAASYGLTFPQFMVLEALLHKDAMSVGEIKDTILSSDGTIPVIIKNLERDGMVRRAKDPSDHRRSMVSLTEAGRELIGRVFPQNEAMFARRFAVWTEDEKRELIGLVSKYHRQLRQLKGDRDAEVR